MAQRELDDLRFGRITLTRGSRFRPDTKPFVAEGERIGRFATLAADRWTTPAGEARVLPSRGLIRRRQHDDRAELAGTTFHLRHTGWFTAEVLRDGDHVARLRTHRQGWGRRKPGDYEVEEWTAAADATAAGVTHLLALWSGVGAEGALAGLTPWPLVVPVHWLREKREAVA